jgi:hypothetical protein
MPLKKFAVTYFLFFALLFAGCTAPPEESAPAVDPEIARLQARAANVEIIRDDFGVPHIYAKTDADAVFGMLYAQAEDDLPGRGRRRGGTDQRPASPTVHDGRRGQSGVRVGAAMVEGSL